MKREWAAAAPFLWPNSRLDAGWARYARLFAEFSMYVLDASAGFVNGFAEVLPGNIPFFGPINHVGFVVGIDPLGIGRGVFLFVVWHARKCSKILKEKEALPQITDIPRWGGE